jgi:hypothetical protein
MSEDKNITITLEIAETRRIVAGLQLMQASLNDNKEDPNFEDAIEPIQAEIDLTRALIQKIRDAGHDISDTSYD